MSEFGDYIRHGWVLVPIMPGSKGPRSRGWNMRKNCITDPEAPMHAAGLAHAYSGTCAIDIDDYDFARDWLAERGVDLDELFDAPESVHLVSGRAGHGKLIYALPEPLASKKVAVNSEGKSALDLRCATAAGLTVQDVLPPSIHPDTGRPYEWQYGDPMLGDWHYLPVIPDALHAIWLQALEESRAADAVPQKGASVTELRDLLRYQDPDINRDEWIRVGMAIHHETDGGAEGLQLWDEWSQGGKKYKGPHDLEVCWRSFHDTPNAVTVGILRQGATASPDEFPDVSGAGMADDDPWAQVERERVARFKLTQVGEIADRDPPAWLVDNLIPQADLAMIYGEPSAGKSFIALDLAFSISTGLPWFHRSVKKGPVVWIAAEAAGAMRNRSRAYAQARGIVLETAELWVVEQTLSLMNTEDAKALTQAVQEAKPVMIIVDTLAAASGGANENSGEDMNVVLDNCRRLHKETGALVLLIHHSGKDASKGARGWSGVRAAVHSEFSVYSHESSPVRRFTVTKQRDAVSGVELPFKLLPVPLGFEDETSCVVEPLDEVLLSEPDKAKLGGNQKLVFRALYDLAKELGDENAAVAIQDVYETAILAMPQAPRGQRDRRTEVVRRALSGLHEKGFVTIMDDMVHIGSPIDDD